MIKKENKTIILYEAPHKLKQTLKDLKEILESRNIVIARELTKIHEEFLRGTVSQILEKYQEPKGEHIILIEANKEKKEEQEEKNFTQMSLEKHYEYYEKQGFTKNEIIKKIAKDRNVSKNEIYQKFI